MPYKDPASQRAYKRRWRAAHVDEERARRRSYYAACPECGGRMSGGNGSANDPKRCAACQRASYPEPAHGTHQRYWSLRFKCRCADCTAANTAYYRERRAREREAVSATERAEAFGG